MDGLTTVRKNHIIHLQVASHFGEAIVDFCNHESLVVSWTSRCSRIRNANFAALEDANVPKLTIFVSELVREMPGK
jgi:cysteine sulfinate desulfinase/cysteine desulfurase-like protein